MVEDNQFSEVDPFVAQSLYPDSEALFSFSLSPLSEIKDDAIIVIDTNALLVPYNIGRDSLSQIKLTYEALISHDRLKVPGQVAREFAKNRPGKTTELFQQFSRKRTDVSTLQKGKYPLLEGVSEYQRVLDLEKEIDELIVKYKESL